MDESNEPRAPQEISLESIMAECFDSPGFVVHVSFIERRLAADGASHIQHRYLRRNFSFEDVKNSIQEFKRAYNNDVTEDVT